MYQRCRGSRHERRGKRFGMLVHGKYRLGDVGWHQLCKRLPPGQDYVPRGVTVGSLVGAMQLWGEQPVAILGAAEPVELATFPGVVKRCQTSEQATGHRARDARPGWDEGVRHVAHDDHIGTV